MSARRAESAREAERRWLALELHDELGQSLTGLLLQLDVASRAESAQRDKALHIARHTAHESLERIRGIVRTLRPEGLDDLGLTGAVLDLCDRMRRDAGLEIQLAINGGIPTLTPEAQVAVYRVIQESLTNVARHAGARRVDVALREHGDGVSVRVRDYGATANGIVAGSGIRGMRERALLVGGVLTVDRHPQGGVVVTLAVPLDEVVA
jgi:two-component system sensor histidine kinase UhpB